ncbi:MAG: SWIM zinc finger family protein, partial [Nocardioidaceae bacterium]
MSEQPNRAFRRTFSRRELQSLAGRRTFERGHGYALDGRVHNVHSTSEQVTAKVRGSASYQVCLWVEDEDAAWGCTCPVGREERFCKHAVAVGLMATGAVEPEDSDNAAEEVDLAGYLTSLDQQALVDLLLERAAADVLFDARLRAAAASRSGGRPDLKSYRQALTAAFETDGYIGYREAYDYTSGIRSVLDGLQLLFDEGHAPDVVALSEYAADLAEDALGYIDDSDGGMSLVAEQLRELHLAACEEARPDPVALARNLYE